MHQGGDDAVTALSCETSRADRRATQDSLVLAVDGGQSSTACVVGRVDGTLLGAGHGGPANHVHQPGGAERLRRALEESITAALDSAGLRGPRIAAAYLSITGGGRGAERMTREIVPVDAVVAEGDAPAALACGTFAKPGIALIAGTGSATLAEQPDGTRIARGGWGYLVGDEGSGFWIGMQAVRAAARAIDGRGPDTVLATAVCSHFGETNLRVVASRIYGFELERPETASLAPVVLLSAEEGDAVAAEIIDSAAGELLLLLEATARAAQLPPEDRVIVATGGVPRPGNRLWRRLEAGVEQRLAGYRLIAPRFQPVVGAYILALKLAGIAIDGPVLYRIEASSARIPALGDKRASAVTATTLQRRREAER